MVRNLYMSCVFETKKSQKILPLKIELTYPPII